MMRPDVRRPHARHEGSSIWRARAAVMLECMRTAGVRPPSEGAGMSRVAIIGSCITRDLWPIRGELQGLYYVSRTSLPSLFSDPVRGVRIAAEPPPTLRRHQHRTLAADLQK